MLDYVDSDRVRLSDGRYDQVVHMVTAASGAEPYYELSSNNTRSEGLDLARRRDSRAGEVYMYIITNNDYYNIIRVNLVGM